MIRVLVAEDEEPQRKALLRMLGELWPEAELVACASGAEALAASLQVKPTAAFLDLRMGDVGGMAVAEALRGSTHVVFVTAHDDQAIRAFAAGAVDYLLKPVRLPRLAESVRRLQARLRPDANAEAEQEWLQWITATVGDCMRLYAIDEVLAFHAQQKYTEVLCAGGQDATIRTSLRELMPRLDPTVFWQVHRSAIVRVAAIEELRKAPGGQLELKLRGRDERLPAVSSLRRRLREL